MNIEFAIEFAKKAHKNQKRKYTGEEYIVHPVAVMELVKSISHTKDMLIAALLHDVVEDTSITNEEIESVFGYSVAEMVWWLTDISKKSDGNRKTRKAIDRDHISKAPADVKTIKLADIYDNSKSISLYDKGFWKVYRNEKILLLQVLSEGDEKLFGRVNSLLETNY